VNAGEQRLLDFYGGGIGSRPIDGVDWRDAFVFWFFIGLGAWLGITRFIAFLRRGQAQAASGDTTKLRVPIASAGAQRLEELDTGSELSLNHGGTHDPADTGAAPRPRFAPLQIQEGQILAATYRVDRVRDLGLEGLLVAADHIPLNEKVTLNLREPQILAANEGATRRVEFRRGPLMKLKSEHTARVTEVGTLPDGVRYMVMEPLDGEDLGVWLEERGTLPVEQAVEFVLQACVAIADAHALGIVHRSLNPANLFCIRRPDGQLSIKVPFYLVVGWTSPYWSPEQWGLPKSPNDRDATAVWLDVDVRTDIWALGTILFELLTGRLPFPGTSLEGLIKIMNEPARRLRTVLSEAPEGLDAVIGRCLEKDRDQRYQNVEELALALLPFAPERAKASVEKITAIMPVAWLNKTAPVPPPPETVTMGLFSRFWAAAFFRKRGRPSAGR
jgi:eukaryotic-like serine/threonine-protein kinase